MNPTMTPHHPFLPPRPQWRRQHGASLLEVLITILILSFGLLGIAGLTATSLQAAKLSQYQSTAMQLVNDYADRMRVNVPGLMAGQYDMTSAYTGATTKVTTTYSCNWMTACDPYRSGVTPQDAATAMAAVDRTEWTNALRQRLPAGGAYVVRDGLAVDIWILWQEPNMQFDASSDLSPAATGGSPCPEDALDGYQGPAPVCIYYRVSI